MAQLESLISIKKLHAAYESGEWNPVSVTKYFLEKVKASRLNAWLTVCEERALVQAKHAHGILISNGNRVPRSEYPLFGVPAGIKDNLAVRGVRMTCASRMLEKYIAPYSATVVERMEKAGAIILGKLNLDEFAMGGSNENSAFGRVEHPLHPGFVPGGSSGGSAAAVAAGECLVALGSDTGGSIRLPASYCGIVGMKPTYGRVSRYGLVAFASSLDQVGPMARNLDDAALLLQVISGYDAAEATSLNLPAVLPSPKAQWRGMRVGIPTELSAEDASFSVRKEIDKLKESLSELGAELIPISLPRVAHSIAVYYVVAVSEASSNLSRFDGVRFGSRPAGSAEANSLEEFHAMNRSLFGPEVKRRILLGTFSLSSGYSDEYFLRAARVRNLIAQDFSDAFQAVDVMISPVAPTTAYRFGEKTTDPLEMYLNDLYTVPANLTGIPALSLPWSHDDQGLPIGVQFMGPVGSDEKLLGIAKAFEVLREGRP